MKIKVFTGRQIRNGIETDDYKWVSATKENLEAIALYKHLKEHPEVINADINKGEPMCKLCNKTAKLILFEDSVENNREVLQEEYRVLSNKFSNNNLSKEELKRMNVLESIIGEWYN